MNSKLKKLLFLFLFLPALLPSRIVPADLGPKPTMEFTFTQEAGQVTITSGILYECEQSDCSDAKPLEEMGPQRFTCDAASCHAMAYGFSPYHRLEIQFSDGKTRQSNLFETAGFNSIYKVTVREDDLLADAQFSLSSLSPTTVFLLLCACAFVGGVLLIVLIIFVIRRLTKK
ncbi:MAG: hypothetical protein MUO77_11450 [Anaerolineales bacterium]|nr:hypothetical protein [Anaerolineales bacterium]